MSGAAELLPGLDQPLVQRVVLVGALGYDVALDRLFEPGPLEHRGLEDRGRRIGVVLEQLCRIPAVEAEVEAAVEAELLVAPAVRDQRPIVFRDFQPPQILLVTYGLADEFDD